MSEKIANLTDAQQIELAIGRLDSLSILPPVATRVLSGLFQPQPSTSALAEIIESDPALVTKIFELIQQQGLSLPGERISVGQVLDKLPVQLIRDVFDDNKGLIVGLTASPYIPGQGEQCFERCKAMVDTVINY